MDDTIAAALDQPFSTAAGRHVWDACGAALGAALGGRGSESFLDAVEEVARNAALTGSNDVQALIEGFAEGSGMVRRALSSSGPEAGETLGRLARLEDDALARIAAGYAAGLEETIQRLRHQTEEASPLDPATGAMRVAETLDLLAVEVDRCRRMAHSLGILGVAVGGGGSPGSCIVEGGADVLHEVAGALRDNVRRYDGVGRTADGDFLVVLPDVSRRALAAIAERLHGEVAARVGEAADWTIALAHYDYVDVSADEMLAALERRVALARARREPQVWV